MLSFTIVATALLASFVSAQSFSALPKCAQNCTINAIPNSCNLDPKCICSDAGFIKGITCCVSKVCDAADQEATLKYANSICVPAGVTNLPTAASCAAGQTATANATSAATGSAAMSASSVMSSQMSAASSAVASASSEASSANSVASLSATSAATSAAAVASSTGDASRAFHAQGLGMVGAAVGAAVALM